VGELVVAGDADAGLQVGAHDALALILEDTDDPGKGKVVGDREGITSAMADGK